MSSAQKTIKFQNALWFVVGCILFAHAMNPRFSQLGIANEVLETAVFGAFLGIVAVALSLLAQKADVWNWKQDMIVYASTFAFGAVAISFFYKFVMYVIANWWAIKIIVVL